MKYSMVADIMFVAPGEHGPVWPDTNGIVAAMELAKANGLDAIEMFDFEGRDLEVLAAKSGELGIGIQAFCMKNGKVWGDPARLEELTAGFRASVAAAKKLGTKNLILSDDGYARDVPREQVHAAMVEGLRRIAPLAEQEGLVILAEPVSGNYFRDSGEAFDILAEVNSPNVLLLYDIFHFQLIEGNILNTLKDNLGRIGHIHGAGAPMRCELTDGELNYRFLLNELDKLGYDKCFGLEFFTFTEREEKVRKSAALLRDR